MVLKILEKIWYQNSRWFWLLLPFSCVYSIIVSIRRWFLTYFLQRQWSIPIIVVGNLTVGGVGKTPLVVCLANALRKKNMRVGIVSRGYGATISTFPCEVTSDSDALEVGDEPLLIAQRTGCPVVIAPRRVLAVKYLIHQYQVQVIISDDGLQHYAMGRTLEMLVIDSSRLLGNGLCLPAGPLRESPRRLDKMNFIIVNNGYIINKKDNNLPLCNLNKHTYPMMIEPIALVNLVTQESIAWTHIQEPVAAIAGIGDPQRFFTMLKGMGMTIKEYPFPDHHCFKEDEFNFSESMVVMTEKDAMKCQLFAKNHWFYLRINAKLADDFWKDFFNQLSF